MASIQTSGEPRLSVLLTAGNRRERVANALASVLMQPGIEQVEVLVLECGDQEPVLVAGQDHPCVRSVRFPQGLTGAHVRAQAVRMARAPLVVFLEEHAAACPGWLESILRDFAEGDWVAVGPEITNGFPESSITGAMALRDYALYEAPALRREPDWLPLHNSAYRRNAVLEHDADLERLFGVEILLQWRLHEAGGRFLLDPACKIIHYYETDVVTIWHHDVNAQRAFVANRAHLYRWPLWKRLLRLLAVPLIPVVRPVKLLRLLMRERPDQLGRFVRELPHMIVGNDLPCAAGEALGLLAGAGNGDVRYLYHSVNAKRRLPADFPHFRLESAP